MGLIMLFDFLSLWKKDRLKILSWTAGSCLVCYSVVMLCLSPDKLGFPLWVMITGGVLTICFCFLMFYTLFMNLPFRRTYYKSRQKSVLIRSGCYALARHPGVPALALLLCSLLLFSGARLLLIAVPVFILADILLVIVEDRYVFPRIFPDYAAYRKETPMLIPNKKSLKVFIHNGKKGII
ncbi:MAG: hypothetical protein JXA46_01235 [Dehalococcoidales bacterium]|nr:hypothetical protein [Dehalococcoidales bacterium]